MYDNAEYLNISYPANLSPEEQLDVITDTAKVSLAKNMILQILPMRPLYCFKLFVCLTSHWLRWPRWWLGPSTCRQEAQSLSWAASQPTHWRWDTSWTCWMRQRANVQHCFDSSCIYHHILKLFDTAFITCLSVCLLRWPDCCTAF